MTVAARLFGILLALGAGFVVGAPQVKHALDRVRADPGVYVAASDGHGSGVYIGNGSVLTNAHVVEEDINSDIDIKQRDGTWLKARVAASFQRIDFAILKVQSGTITTPAGKVRCKPPAPGDYVFTTASPVSAHFVTLQGYVASEVRRHGGHDLTDDAPMQVLDMFVGPGASGAGIRDRWGRVVGVMQFMYTYNGSPLALGGMIPSVAFCPLLEIYR